MSVIRQLSLFGVEAATPEAGDLAGLLIGGGECAVGDAGAQVSVVVTHPWRAAALVTECARRGLAATSIATVGEHITVRTAYSELLRPLAAAWGDAETLRVPRGLVLDGRVLRLWVIVQGHGSGHGSVHGAGQGGGQGAGHGGGPGAYVLPVGRLDEPGREAIGAALAAIGIGAQLVSPRGGAGPSYRIVGRRRLVRLAEMVGDPPKQAPADIWPS
jgi:hypothetical protein